MKKKVVFDVKLMCKVQRENGIIENAQLNPQKGEKNSWTQK